MTEKEALKVLAREEKRFVEAGFGRGKLLAKSAWDYHKAILGWRKKCDACAADYSAAKKRLDAFTAELKRKEAQARKLLDDVVRIRKVCVPLKKTAGSRRSSPMPELRRRPRQSASASRIVMRGRCTSDRNRKALVNGIAYRPEVTFR